MEHSFYNIYECGKYIIIKELSGISTKSAQVVILFW